MQYPRVRRFLKDGTIKKWNYKKKEVKHDGKTKRSLRPSTCFNQRVKYKGTEIKIWSSNYKSKHKYGWKVKLYDYVLKH